MGRAYNKRKLGEEQERKAGEYLKEQGYEIVKYNFRCKMGEIDIIAKDSGYLVFCEVKYRSSNVSGHPLEAVNQRKQQILSKCALYYLTVNGLQDIPCRFDVISVTDEGIQVVKNAFDYMGGH